jgi:hypothetical protein
MEGMGKQNTYERINKEFEKEILGIARVSNELQAAGLLREAWYCCLLVRLGESMISFGTRLTIIYSPHPTLRTK